MGKPSRDVVVVTANDDHTGCVLARHLAGHGLPVRTYEPTQLASLITTIDGDEFLIDRSRVGAVLWRAMPRDWLSMGFQTADQPFADNETAAVWLSGMRTTTVVAVNAFSATAWYGGGQWPVWRHLLRAHRVAVSPMQFGSYTTQACGHWLLLSGFALHALPGETAARALGITSTTAIPTNSALVVCGRMLGSEVSANAQAAAAALATDGIGLARIILDQEQRILAVDPLPACSEEDIQQISHRLAEVFHAHLLAR